MSKQKNQSSYEIREAHIRGTKNHYKMMWVKLYRSALDVMLFYLAFIFFRYKRFTDLPEYGFRYNYFMTIAWKVE